MYDLRERMTFGGILSLSKLYGITVEKSADNERRYQAKKHQHEVVGTFAESGSAIGVHYNI